MLDQKPGEGSMSFVMAGDSVLDNIGPVPYFVLIVITDILLCIFAARRGHLSFSGTIATMFVGCTTFWFLGLAGWMCLIVFFFTSSRLTKLTRTAASQVAAGIQKKGGCRDYMQVLANGGPATLAALLYGFTGNPLFITLFGAAIAESNADTWAGEVGILSPKPPVMITTFKPVQKGLSGGVTVLGTSAGFVASVVIAVTWYIGFHGVVVAPWLQNACVIAIAGFIGSVVDSLLGATVQAHFWDEVRQQITEHEVTQGRQNRLCRGWRFMDNDIVNLVSNLSAMAAAAGLVKVFGL